MDSLSTTLRLQHSITIRCMEHLHRQWVHIITVMQQPTLSSLLGQVFQCPNLNATNFLLRICSILRREKALSPSLRHLTAFLLHTKAGYRLPYLMSSSLHHNLQQRELQRPLTLAKEVDHSRFDSFLGLKWLICIMETKHKFIHLQPSIFFQSDAEG